MKRKLLCLIAFLPFLGFGQTVFSENWDGSGQGITAWTVIDVDGQTPNVAVDFATDAWVVVDKLGDDGNFGGPAGDHAAISISWYTPAGTSNDWLISPAIDISSSLSAFLSWDAKAQDADFPDGYEVRLSPTGGSTIADFTVVLFSTAGENPEWTTRVADLSTYVGSPVRIAFVNNSNDMFALLVDNILVTETEPELPFPYPYCAVTGLGAVEAMTKVEFAGISNVTAADDEETAHEDFTSQTAAVTAGQSYPIVLEGNTAGAFQNFFAVYIDWNQNLSYDDEGEAYQIGSITGSTGEDGMQATGPIAVPPTALEGTTRMRVIKNWGNAPTSACNTGGLFGGFGQAEEYSVAVSPALAVNGFNTAAFEHFPNPVKNIFNVSYNQNISEVKIFNILGQEVLTKSVNASKGQIDMSSLPTGNYVAKITSANAVKTIKVIKE